MKKHISKPHTASDKVDKATAPAGEREQENSMETVLWSDGCNGMRGKEDRSRIWCACRPTIRCTYDLADPASTCPLEPVNPFHHCPLSPVNPYTAVYFIGIGGIGMSALARYYKQMGLLVAGYDRTPSPLTEALEKEGIAVHFNDRVSAIPKEVLKQPKEKVLIIYTPAVPAEHRELLYFHRNEYTIVKRSKALGRIALTKETLAVAGTHGKTTTATLLAHLLTVAGNGCVAFLGGISKNYNTNLVMTATKDSKALVVEADEYDRSFLQLHPHVSVITSIDADHLDIYGTKENLTQAFLDFSQQLHNNGLLILNGNLPDHFIDHTPARKYRYSLSSSSDFYASNIRCLDNGLPNFTLHMPNGELTNCTLGIPGRVNVENAVAAVTAAWAYGLNRNKVKRALASFAGVQRRFDVQVNTSRHTYVDDYAHHPEELRATIASLRETYPCRKITGVFQPHLYSRTRDFYREFAASLSLLDELILLPIYPAREQPMAGVTSQMILDLVSLEHKQLCEKETLLKKLKKEKKNIDVLVTFGAGDIDRLVKPIAAAFGGER